jgi:HK97 family phage prohead protease
MNLGAMIEMEEKALSENADAFVFEGYAAVFNNKDLGGDVIMPGAFKKSLRDHDMPLLLFNHKMDDLPIGVIEHAEEDQKGLRVKGELPKDDPVARRVGRMLKANASGKRALKGMSIGYKAEKHDRKDDGTRYLHQIRLYETSFVNIPMNPKAGVETIKSAERIGIAEWKDFSVREREAHLKACGMSDDLAKRIVRLEREARADSGQREAGVGAIKGDLESVLASLNRMATR